MCCDWIVPECSDESMSMDCGSGWCAAEISGCEYNLVAPDGPDGGVSN